MIPPRFAWATPELAEAARHLRDQRAKGDAAMVEAGRLTPAQAADRLRIASAIADDWTAYEADRLPADRHVASLREKHATLVDAAAGAAARRDRLWGSFAEWPHLQQLTRGALWQLVDANDPLTHHIQPYLGWESYTAALDALAWWHDPAATRPTKRAVIAGRIADRAAAVDRRAA